MDVHYLPSNRHFKSPKEYILDFFIIFLAVILGFIANDMIESYLEKAKVKEYAQLLFDDLKSDISNIQRTYTEKEWIEQKYDTVENILATKDIREYNEFIYYTERYLSNNSIFTSQDMTFLQLRNTGNLRYFKDINLLKKIVDYYSCYNQYTLNENIYETSCKNDLTGIESKLFNPRDLTSLDNSNSTDYYSLVIQPVLKLKPIKRDIDNLKLFYIKVDEAKKHANNTKLLLQKQKNYAVKLMDDLKKEYHLK